MNKRRERSALGKIIAYLEAQEDKFVCGNWQLVNKFQTSEATVIRAKNELMGIGWKIEHNFYSRGYTDSTFTYYKPEGGGMPKSPSRTARGQIDHYLRGKGRGVEFTISGIAGMFNTSENNVAALLRELRMNGWTIDQKGASMRGSVKPRYIAAPPGGL